MLGLDSAGKTTILYKLKLGTYRARRRAIADAIEPIETFTTASDLESFNLFLKLFYLKSRLIPHLQAR